MRDAFVIRKDNRRNEFLIETKPVISRATALSSVANDAVKSAWFF
jgi:hypothetical protein